MNAFNIRYFLSINKDKIKENLQISFVIFVILFLLGRCVYSFGYTWSCEDAKQELSKAEEKLSQAFRRAEDKLEGRTSKSSEDIERSIQ